jgi:ADP-ribose pyrophosphatase YjhB (NUDIX family)
MPHIHEKIDFTVEVFIVHDSKVLLRKHDKYGIWLGVGGHIELDEDPIEAAVRECKEEVDLNISIIGQPLSFKNTVDQELTPPLFMNRHKIDEKHEHLALVYAANSDTDEYKENEGLEKSRGLKWFSEAELDDLSYGLMENIIHYAKTALRVSKLNK